MRNFITTVIFLAANTSMAFVGSNNTWSEIFAAKNISLLFEENLGGIDLRNACLETSEIRTIKPIKYCPKLVSVKAGQNRDTYTNWVCEKWVVGTYSYPRTASPNMTVADQIRIRVVQTQGSYSTYPGFQKLYTFPSCSK